MLLNHFAPCMCIKKANHIQHIPLEAKDGNIFHVFHEGVKEQLWVVSRQCQTSGRQRRKTGFRRCAEMTALLGASQTAGPHLRAEMGSNTNIGEEGGNESHRKVLLQGGAAPLGLSRCR